MNNSSVPIELNRFSMLTIEKSECLPSPPPPLPRPRSPAFIDTLSSCLRDGTQESYLSVIFFFFFFFYYLFFFILFFVLFFVVVVVVVLLLFFFETKCIFFSEPN